MKLKSRLLRKAYGLDVSGTVFDADQDNVQDKANPRKDGDQGEQDWDPRNMVTDTSLTAPEQEEINEAHLSLNPHI